MTHDVQLVTNVKGSSANRSIINNTFISAMNIQTNIMCGYNIYRPIN